MGGTRKPGDSWAVARNVLARQHRAGAVLEICFTYRGVRCRESLKLPPTPASNVRYAERTLAEIETAIARQTFRYADYFPNSKRAAQFGDGATQRTVQQLLLDYLALCEAAVGKGNMAESTLVGYRRIIRNVLIPEFGAHRAHELGAAHIKAWVSRQDATAKRVRNVLSPLRVVLAGALNDGDIDRNPFDRLDLGALLQKTAKASAYEVDPFTQQERDAILAACRTDQERHLYGLWFETGLRTGELIALQWRHVDWVGRRLAVRDNYTAGQLKGPKTEAGLRDVELSDEALAVLRQQKALTGLADAHIFHNPRTNAAWESDQAIRRTSWDHTCRLAGVRRRNPYQIRHTWGSRMVSAGYNLFWVAEQMGHETIEMVINHYGHWMPGEGKKVRLDRHGTPVAAATHLPRRTVV